MTAPSKLGPAVLSLFGLPFLGMGLFAGYSFLNADNQPLSARIGASIFGSVFATIGGGLIFGSWYGYGLQKKRADVQTAHPDAPWLWREDWAAGRAEGKNNKSVSGWWIGALLVNMLLLPVFAGTIGRAVHTRDPVYMVPAAFGLVGLLTLLGAIRATLRLKRFGKTYFEINSVPFSPGGRVAGSIHMQPNAEVAHGIDVKLTCFRRVESGAGQNRSWQQIPLWEVAKHIAAGSLARGPLDTIVPVEFHVPADVFQTDHDNASDQVFWMLKANADAPGVNYTDEFEVPLFVTASSRASASSQTTTAVGGTVPDARIVSISPPR